MVLAMRHTTLGLLLAATAGCTRSVYRKINALGTIGFVDGEQLGELDGDELAYEFLKGLGTSSEARWQISE